MVVALFLGSFGIIFGICDIAVESSVIVVPLGRGQPSLLLPKELGRGFGVPSVLEQSFYGFFSVSLWFVYFGVVAALLEGPQI